MDGSVLVIEDDLVALGIFEQILQTNGYAVRVATDVESGLAELRRQTPAAMLIDLHLPTASGLEFVRQLRKMDSLADLPIALITGDYLVDERLVREIEDHGVRIHFKPLWEEDLLRVVKGLLDDECP
jgi:DNA-binding response OmpR family regulator